MARNYGEIRIRLDSGVVPELGQMALFHVATGETAGIAGDVRYTHGEADDLAASLEVVTEPERQAAGAIALPWSDDVSPWQLRI